MIVFEQVLCRVDFSDTATRALAHAAAPTRWHDARLTIMHVVPVFEGNMQASFPFKGDEGRTPYAAVRADVPEQIRHDTR